MGHRQRALTNGRGFDREVVNPTGMRLVRRRCTPLLWLNQHGKREPTASRDTSYRSDKSSW